MAKKRVQSKSEMKRLAVLQGRDIESVFEKDPDHKKMVAQHAQVQKDIAKLPVGKRNAILAAQAEVDMAIDEMNELNFSENAFEADRRSKGARDLEHRLSVGRITVISDELDEYGKKVLKIINKDVVVKTPYNKVIPAQVYVDALQDSVIALGKAHDALNKELLAANLENTTYKYLRFVDLIKLAFKRLITRSK